MSKETKELSLIDNLKLQADKLGIKYSPNIGQSKLQDRIKEAIIAKVSKPAVLDASLPETYEQRRARKRKEATELVRIKVTCFDPTMKKRAGTYIMASNNLVGTIRKFIQFNKPWFMPRMLVNTMKESKYQGWVEGKTEYGITRMISSMENRYNVVLMPQITPKELDAIKKRQTVTNSLED
jgi:hypothetical protein